MVHIIPMEPGEGRQITHLFGAIQIRYLCTKKGKARIEIQAPNEMAIEKLRPPPPIPLHKTNLVSLGTLPD